MRTPASLKQIVIWAMAVTALKAATRTRGMVPVRPSREKRRKHHTPEAARAISATMRTAFRPASKA